MRAPEPNSIRTLPNVVSYVSQNDGIFREILLAQFANCVYKNNRMLRVPNVMKEKKIAKEKNIFTR